MPRRVELLGTFVDAMPLVEFLDVLAKAISSEKQFIVLNHNMHSLALRETVDRFDRLYDQADLVFIDGMAVVGLLRLLGRKVGPTDRLAVLDWIWPFFREAAVMGWKVVHLGSDDELIRKALHRIAEVEPSLEIEAIPGYFDPTAGSPGSEEALQNLKRARPDVLLLGMGMPRQELWLLDHLDRLPDCLIVTVGGILGFIGGDRPTAPRWVGRLGGEWLFRLCTEPKRLWRRYLVEPWVLAQPLAREVVQRAAPQA